MKKSLFIVCFVFTATAVFAFQQVTYPPELEALFTNIDTAVGKQALTPVDQIGQLLDNGPVFQDFAREHGQWRFFIDTRSGQLGFMDGKGIPFIPGNGVDNTVTMKDLAPFAKGPVTEVTSSVIETKVRYFLEEWQELFKLDLDDLVLDRDATFQATENLWYVRFAYVPHGVPVENAFFVVRISHGNIIQIGQEGISPVQVDPVPQISREEAWITIEDYLAGSPPLDIEKGTLKYIALPVKQWQRSAIGSGYSHMLVWDFYFRVEGYAQQYRAWINAHTGKVVLFRDETKYGYVDGGIYPVHNEQTEEVKPFPYADYGTGVYTDLAGYYSGTSGTSTLAGEYVTISDTCGSISLASDGSGNINFGTSTGIDCDTPGVGGTGNTHASRSCFYHVNLIKEKARKYKPSNSWLQGNLTSNVNIDQTCNAFWNGSTINFYQSGDGCNNTGELAGVFLHEWAHGLDQNDGNGSAPDGGSGETYGDWTATLQLHNSCVGQTFRLEGLCGYGNACSSCTGVREIDYEQYATPTPATVTNSKTAGLYACPTSSSCYGPCGLECHCESVLATQALWDLAVRELPAQGYDSATSWQLSDKFWYVSRGSEGATYQCDDDPETNGCNSGSLYNLYRAVDDVDGNLNNGTPHAASIFTSLNRHEIGCGLSTDPENQNSSECPFLFSPTLSGSAGDNQIQLSWNSVSGATAYILYRNELSCDAGFTEVYNGAALSYTDNYVVNDVTYYYRVMATSNGGDCISAMSNCQTLTPSATSCTMTVNVTPDGTTTVCGGVNIVFMATPTGGTSPYTYQWTEDSSDISGATNATLTRNYGPAQSHTYNCKVSDAGDCVDIIDTSDSTGTWTTQPTAPTISSVSDLDACAATGVSIVFTSGSGATSHNLWVDGSQAVTGITSPYTYVPGNTSSHSYVVRAVNGSCYANSNAVAGTDLNDAVTTAPVITSIVDHDPFVQDGVNISYTAGSPATSHDLWCDGSLVVTGFVSGGLYNPGDLDGHYYFIRAINGSCYADSATEYFQEQVGVMPPEITPVSWSGKETLTWTEETTATNGYILYRGLRADLAELLTSNTDFCIRWTGSSSSETSATGLTETGPAEDCYYYLVTGVSGVGEGTAGAATAGERQVDDTGACP
ncbi:hypothetical protein JXQ70_12145 [bacterium]|nr:hypothetical protein [bacterium]